MHLSKPLVANVFVLPPEEELDTLGVKTITLEDYPILRTYIYTVDAVHPYSIGEDGDYYTTLISAGREYVLDLSLNETLLAIELCRDQVFVKN